MSKPFNFVSTLAKKLPKNEGAGPQPGQGRRLAENEQTRQSSNCCSKWWSCARHSNATVQPSFTTSPFVSSTEIQPTPTTTTIIIIALAKSTQCLNHTIPKSRIIRQLTVYYLFSLIVTLLRCFGNLDCSSPGVGIILCVNIAVAFGVTNILWSRHRMSSGNSFWCYLPDRLILLKRSTVVS